MNRAILIGRLTRDPELRTTSNTGVSVCTFTVAVDRRRSRDREKEADFIPVVVWREQAENCAKYLRKGSQVGVCGSIQTRSYDAQDGSKRYVTEVVCDECEFVDSKPQGDGQSYGGGSSYGGGQSYGGSAGYGAPAQKPSAAPANDFASQGFTQVDDDDQLPF